MAATIGIEGLISVPDTSGGAVDQTGFDLHHVLGSGVGPYSATLNESADSADTTEWASSVPVASTMTTGLKGWTMSVNGRFPGGNAKFGKCGQVTFANGYVLGSSAWAMALACGFADVTEFESSCPEYRAFLPGIISGSGSWTSLIDDTTAIAGTGDSGAAVFRLTKESSVDNTLACNIHSVQEAASIAVGSKNGVVYNYVVNGNVTAAGDSPLFNSGALVRPDVTEVVLRAAGSRTYTGMAFWTSIGISVALDGLIDISLTLQGTGAIVRA